MRTLVLILFVVLILVIAWYAFGNTGQSGRRVIQRPASRRVVRRRATTVEHEPEPDIVVEERRFIE